MQAGRFGAPSAQPGEFSNSSIAAGTSIRDLQAGHTADPNSKRTCCFSSWSGTRSATEQSQAAISGDRSQLPCIRGRDGFFKSILVLVEVVPSVAAILSECKVNVTMASRTDTK